MRVVIDTVVFVRALMNPRGLWGQLLFDRADEYAIIVSPEIAQEVLEVINRPKIRRRLSVAQDIPPNEQILGRLQDAEVVEPRNRIDVCRDPNDNKFIECAVEGRADYIISEDADLLEIKAYEGIRIVSAEEFLNLLDEK